ncbi:MAG: DEAD/DEAH box helicase [bacterium]|nr:DEAD/DEAH box helicase [bacterium]
MYKSNFSGAKRRPSSGGFRRSGSPHSNSRGRRGPAKQDIHPSKFVKAAIPVEELIYTALNKFSDFELHDRLKENIIHKGFITPSRIQDETIALALTGRDIVGIANTGTGKTAAFGIPVLNKIALDKTKKALIIAPTRELAMQIGEELRSFGGGLGVFSALLIGGTPMRPQLSALQRNPNIVIGTPGRIKDHIERKSLNLLHFDTIVLDEVDRMLDMGFIIDIRFILERMAQPRQSLFFSATMDSKISTLIDTFSKDPARITTSQGITSDHVEQNVVYVEANETKHSKLHDLLLSEEIKKVLIFDETKHGVEKLGKELVARGFKADALHGGKSQGQRKRALDKFRNNEINILVATDVAARGIDVADITHVINYTTPQTYDDYIHRIGRAGRAGRKGYALTFIN